MKVVSQAGFLKGVAIMQMLLRIPTMHMLDMGCTGTAQKCKDCCEAAEHIPPGQ